MAQITFDKLKEECVREFCSKNTRGSHGTISIHNVGKLAIAQLCELKTTGKFKNPRILTKEIEDDCVKAIENIDIRNLKPLIELCPDSVPKWIKTGSYTLDLTDKGWTFFKN